MSERLYAIWLSLACTAGTQTFKKLLLEFSSPEEIYLADEEDISSAIGEKSRDLRALFDKSLDRANEILHFCTSKNVGILTYFDDEFPISLKNIKNPPVLLYYRGKLPDFNSEFFVSVVGTRHLTPYGRKNAFTISYDLSRAGAIVVSGMARGIDGVALAGAVAGGAPTVAVIGSGIDVCYPIEHKRLAKEITKCGCVMTEYAPGTRPERFNFPTRNRLISGLSSATLVIEGNEKSGALITARCAADQGRAVYALPGNVGNETSAASNLLIKNGAKLFTSADDIVADFEKDALGHLNPFVLSERKAVDINSVLTELEVSCVTHADDIFRTPHAKAEPMPDAVSKPETSAAANEPQERELPPSFDKSLVELYKKIPHEGSCSIEALVDSGHTLRDVMQGILKLEISKFVTMLPGDRVKRI